MLLSVVLALFLPCAGMTAIFVVYICLLCYAARRHHHHHHNQPDVPVKPATETGLSSAELEKLPVTAGKDLVLGTECAVCLDDVEPEQLARMFPEHQKKQMKELRTLCE
ncbi:hypothetical protein L1987_79060 [Smallanthus sonchifolius]|uniref:Uncharacterized protein n=1 Tax=Smallanthus sonchifolius TaxID=185202 RepID=A0ACB8ZEA3_9ASTR|nr:hypothetical protein L1987_79060 [Smallanthus sonchifolius]